MKKLGWLLIPCLAAWCPQKQVENGVTARNFISAMKQEHPDDMPESNEPITELEQLLVEISLACESYKTYLNKASTFETIITQLHIRKQAGVEMLKYLK